MYSVLHDLLGEENQALDGNWQLCDQNIPAGQQFARAMGDGRPHAQS